MNKITNLLLFAFLFFLIACSKQLIYFTPQELVTDFENHWWYVQELEDNCIFFDNSVDKKENEDGKIFVYTYENDKIYYLTFFDRIDGGYYIEEMDIFILIFINKDGENVAKITSGLLHKEIMFYECEEHYF